MSAPLSSSKKCPHCGFWSEWGQQVDDRCARCGQLLDPVRSRHEHTREKEAKEALPGVMLIEIKPEDGRLRRFFKYIVRGGQLAFAALLAFMLWLLTALAG